MCWLMILDGPDQSAGLRQKGIGNVLAGAASDVTTSELFYDDSHVSSVSAAKINSQSHRRPPELLGAEAYTQRAG
ncbi:hypothetical protein PG994_003619 [Apiospora phragmitis]|uniref:Uncharacterized protein n=1 Tax=Apiospora phragmitis TaxID=2905665 RepID=A0ABR1VYR7_9PEZI